MTGPGTDREDSLRRLAWFSKCFVAFHWWIAPALSPEWTEKWLWSLDPARWFPLWFRILVPTVVILLPWRRFPPRSTLATRIPGWLSILLMSLGGGILFWSLRVGGLELGDSLLLINQFMPLTTYASVREPLESILHTEFARILFFGWGVHPKTGFMIQSCLFGMATLFVGGWVLLKWTKGKSISPLLMLCVFLVGPVHLFFGYLEWYTQLAAGLILFQIFAIRTLLTGRGLGWALGFLVFAFCSHLVGLAFAPAAFVLIASVRKGREFVRTSIVFSVASILSLAATIFVLNFRIHLEASFETTKSLFYLLLPLIREDNPANPPGSWTYPWLSANHLVDLANEILLCGLFPILLWTASRRFEGKGESEAGVGENSKRDLRWFFWAQGIPCALFLLVWNPWLGFPGDWDLFSFFAWPLLAASVVFAWSHTPAELRRTLFGWAAIPAFSLVFSWVVTYHRGELPRWRDVFAFKDREYYDHLLADAKADCAERDWNGAYEKVERILKEAPDRKADAFSVFDVTTIQRMTEEWGPIDRLCPLAVDFEVISASPQVRILVLDVWGRVFFWEGGYFNDWSFTGLPGVPLERAVDMEIVPWTRSGVVLGANGDLFRFSIPSWVDPNPPGDSPRLTHVLKPALDRSLKPIGNFFENYAQSPLSRGQRAVDLILDLEKEKFVVLDTTGNLTPETEGRTYGVEWLTALSRVDAEFDPRSKGCYTVNWFSHVNLWPGGEPSMKPAHEFYWPAVTDLEVGFGGADFYVLDGQGGVVAVSEFGNPQIQSKRLRHFHPTGEPSELTPYLMEMNLLFIDLELVPGAKAYYKMAKNFAIYYSEMPESEPTPP